MSKSPLKPAELRTRIDRTTLGFKDTAELTQLPCTWIGQPRAEQAARFGLAMRQPDYHLFVLGEAGSGRSSLLHRAMMAAAAQCEPPVDLCYLHNFDLPENPLALHVPAGQGRLLRQSLTDFARSLPDEITRCLNAQDFKIQREQVLKKYNDAETRQYTKLDAFAEKRRFSIRREADQIIFTLMDDSGKALTEDNLFKLPKARRKEIEDTEQQLQTAINVFFEAVNRIQHDKNAALLSLQRNTVKPLLNREIKKIRDALHGKVSNSARLKMYFNQVILDILDNLALFETGQENTGARQDAKRRRALEPLLARYQINLAVDNHETDGAPVIREDNPQVRTLFGSIDCRTPRDDTDDETSDGHLRIRAGSLHSAHGGFIMLHLNDLLTDNAVWTKLRRFLRSNRLQIEEPNVIPAASILVTTQPEAVTVNVKIVLIGTYDDYYFLQEEDPEFIRRFRVKVDFTDSFKASPETYSAFSVFVARLCQSRNLPHFTAAAVARLLEESHREVEDQTQQSAIFARTEMLVLESAACCSARNGKRTDVADIDMALTARTYRHDAPDHWLRDAIADGDILIALHGEAVGQLNALTQIDMGDYRFGTPVRVTARTFAGEDGLLNIAHEVHMSGPIHDKGVLILQNYLSALFNHLAPLALSASIVFEQEYSGIEGDSASCAEFFALLSALAQIPVKQSIAVTGALNQFGDVLPVGGINEKIEGFFNICKRDGLTGDQGVLIPAQNRRNLMLNYAVIDAVRQGMFHIYTMQHVTEGIMLLTGMPAGLNAKKKKKYPSKTVLGQAEKTLITYRYACQMSHSKPE